MPFFTGDPSNPSRFGVDIMGAGDATDLFLKIYGGEVLTAFNNATIMRDKTYRRQIQSGKSAQFPRVWKLDATMHTAGEEMLGQTTSQTEKVITLDGMIVSPVALYDLDVAMSHFDVRSVYTQAAGQAIAEVYDKNLMRTVVLGARESMTSPFPSGKRITTADVTGLSGGFADATLTGTPNALGLVGAARAARLFLRQQNVPDSMPVYGVLPPTYIDMLKWARLASGSSAFFGDLILENNTINGATQSVAMPADSILLEGIRFFPSNLLPQVDETSDGSVFPKYRADYSVTAGIIWAPMGVGTLELLGMSMEMQRDARRKETFIVASMAVGHGVLRNELCIEITKLASV